MGKIPESERINLTNHLDDAIEMVEYCKQQCGEYPMFMKAWHRDGSSAPYATLDGTEVFEICNFDDRCNMDCYYVTRNTAMYLHDKYGIYILTRDREEDVLVYQRDIGAISQHEFMNEMNELGFF